MAHFIDDLSMEEMELENRYRQEKAEFKKRRDKALREEEFNKASEILFSMYKSLQAQGFTPEQAWELMTITINNNK